MGNIELKDAQQFLKSINLMIDKSEKAQIKFKEGTSQYTLLKNRINALNIAYSLIHEKIFQDSITFEIEDLKKSVAPIESLISKSEKAKIKLRQHIWQYKMLEENIQSLYIALLLIKNKLED